MTNEELIDTQLDDLRDKLPQLLRQNARALAFLQAVGERAAAISEAAAIMGDSEASYAKQRITEVLISFARETAQGIP